MTVVPAVLSANVEGRRVFLYVAHGSISIEKERVAQFNLLNASPASQPKR
jgi:hypothetical protein